MVGELLFSDIPDDFADDSEDAAVYLGYSEGVEAALLMESQEPLEYEVDFTVMDLPWAKKSEFADSNREFSSLEGGGYLADSEGEGFVPDESSEKGDFMSYGRSYGRRRWSPAFTQGYYAGKRSAGGRGRSYGYGRRRY